MMVASLHENDSFVGRMFYSSPPRGFYVILGIHLKDQTDNSWFGSVLGPDGRIRNLWIFDDETWVDEGEEK